MRTLLLTALFLLPSTLFAATFEVSLPDIKAGEEGVGIVYVVPEGKGVYTAQSVISYDQAALSIDNIVFAPSWIPLTQEGYALEEEGYVLKTAGFPGGITQKTELFRFDVTKKNSDVAVLAVESRSKLYGKDGKNLFAGSVIASIAGYSEEVVLPREFAVSEAASPVFVEEIKQEVAPIEEVEDLIELQAAVITVEGELPVLELTIVLLVLLLGIGIASFVRFRKKVL
ncbi:MAG: hypothetical protein ACJKSS_00410 [Patescibacteria group bacterium UBA2103]